MTMSNWQEPLSKAEMEAMRRAARDEEGVILSFWDAFRRIGRRLPFATDMLAAFYAASDPATPARVRLLILGALAYFVMPADAVPDILPFLGFGDDAAVIGTTIAAVRAHMREEHWQKARDFLAP
jgi:uncharacterized membrane protein YkvA (DUF1232 family)